MMMIILWCCWALASENPKTGGCEHWAILVIFLWFGSTCSRLSLRPGCIRLCSSSGLHLLCFILCDKSWSEFVPLLYFFVTTWFRSADSDEGSMAWCYLMSTVQFQKMVSHERMINYHHFLACQRPIRICYGLKRGKTEDQKGITNWQIS